MQRLLLALMLSLAAGGFCQAAGEIERVQKLGDLEARLNLETPGEASSAGEHVEVRLSGEILRLAITGPADLEVTVPKQLLQTKNWESARVRPDESTLLPDGRRRWQGVFRLEPDRPGQASLQLAAVQARASGTTRAVQWPTISVMVTTSIQRVSPTELIEDAPLLPLEGWQESSLVVPAWIAAVSLAAGFGTIGYVRYRARHRLREEEPIPWLKRRLVQLRTRNVGTPRESVRFYSDLADLLRQYIERRYALPAPTRTTREFLGELQENTALDEQQRALLDRFLRQCDLVKFANEAPSAADCNAAIELVERFVDGGLTAK
jgi:hypothetical protein